MANTKKYLDYDGLLYLLPKLAKKTDIVQVDDVFKADSTNPVQNKVIHSYFEKTEEAINGLGKTKVDKVDGKDLSTNDFTNDLKTKLSALPTNTTLESTYAKKSDIASVYKLKGTANFTDLKLSDVEEGYVYNISNSFTTNDYFIEGAGIEYPAGTNIVCTKVNDVKMWDVLGGYFDLSPYATKDELKTLDTDINTLLQGMAEADDLNNLKTTVTNLEKSKQDKLTAGEGIELTSNSISAPARSLIKKMFNEAGSVFKSIEYDTTTGKFVCRDYDQTSAETKDEKKVIATLDDIDNNMVALTNEEIDDIIGS